MALAPKTRLQEKYRLEKVLGQDGRFDTTYVATNLATDEVVTVREYFPSMLAQRAGDGHSVRVTPSEVEHFTFGKAQFLKEGAVLRRLNHPNIVREYEAFEANGTAYRVGEYHEGATLGHVLANRDEPLGMTPAFQVMKAVLSSLHAAHQGGLIHGGVSPDTIFLNTDGVPMLTSFRIARILLAGKLGTTVGEEGPFTPPEQLQPDGRQGPWSDVYAAAAVLAYLLTGQPIPDLETRGAGDEHLFQDTDLAPPFQEVLAGALHVNPARRPRSIPAFKEELLAAVQAVQQTSAEPSAPEPSARDEKDPYTGPEVHEVAPPQDVAQETDHRPAEGVEPDVADAEVEATDEVTGVSDGPTTDDRETDVPARDETEAFEPEPADSSQILSVESQEEKAEPAAEAPAEIHIEESHEQLTEPSLSDRAPEDTVDEETEVYDDHQEVTAEEHDPRVETAADFQTGPNDERSDEVVAEPEHEAPEAEALDGPPAPPERASDRPPEGKEQKRSSRVLVTGIGVVAMVLIAGLAYALSTTVALGTDGDGPGFGLMKAQGDSLFEAGNYAQAATFYQQALMARPDDEHVSQRLSESEQRIDDARRAQFLGHRDMGDRLLEEADALLSAGDAAEAMGAYDEASRAYLQALPFRPDDPDLLNRIDQASRGMNEAYLAYSQQGVQQEGDGEEPSPENIEEALFQRYLAQAEEQWENEDYQGALRRYEDALDLRPGDEYVLEQMGELEQLLSESADVEAYQQHITRAEAMLAQDRLAEAIAQFEQALDLRPGDVSLQARIADIEAQRMEQREREEQYSYHRAQGDILQSEGRHQEAVQSYRNALQFRPGDDYVREQIAVSEEQIARMEAEEQRAARMRDGVYLVTDEQPQLVGSLSDLYSDIRYPRRAREAGVQGRVYVQFVVDETGAVQNAEVMRGIGFGCDEEAVRVIEQARFEPARVDGQPVPAQHTLMIEFRLQDDED